MLVNLASFAALSVPLALAWWGLEALESATALVLAAAAVAMALVVVWPVAAAGFAAMLKELIETRDGSIRTFFAGLKQYGLRAIGLGLAFVLAEVLFAVSVWFYASRFGARVPLLGYGLSALALWAMAFAGFMALYAMPALVQKNGGVFATIRLSALLVLDNPILTFGMAIALLPLLAACAAPPVLMLFSMAPLMAVLASVYEMLARKYAAVEAHKSQGLSGKPRVDFGDEDDDYLNRGFRDMLYPWKG